MAWWDYGYQINGIANRTTLADGNTWNHEHIALLGKCLVSPELEGHKIVRHLADYVLVWTTRFAGMRRRRPRQVSAHGADRGIRVPRRVPGFLRGRDGTTQRVHA